MQSARQCSAPQPRAAATKRSLLRCSAVVQADTTPGPAAVKEHVELSVCINKTCKKQGSQQVRAHVCGLHLRAVAEDVMGRAYCRPGRVHRALSNQLEYDSISNLLLLMIFARAGVVVSFVVDSSGRYPKFVLRLATDVTLR